MSQSAQETYISRIRVDVGHHCYKGATEHKIGSSQSSIYGLPLVTSHETDNIKRDFSTRIISYVVVANYDWMTLPA